LISRMLSEIWCSAAAFIPFQMPC
jgi:hypothetical protein